MNHNLLIALFSIVPLGIGVHLWQKGIRLIRNGKKAEGIVFKNNYKGSINNKTGLYFPVVRFLTEKQEWITQELDIGQYPALEEGKKIRLIYNQENPEEVGIDSVFRLEILPRILVVVGIILLTLGLLGYLDVIELNFNNSIKLL
ncbi:DUF3592 domain-containing protein [Marivirga arenosa]|uniref:DUF3592 domain-containing protein n=1 Tax=Marivirga arenosa TaxID=3059076 RepID=A0AA49GF98_9BACT|nr:DUF3592 domain-containing protein [Marivirga sp. ABR2-2]WKK87397.2 DUF3592 domain-containing protein [Marivirga sp. ABR2-2]